MGGRLGDWWYGIEQEPLWFKGHQTLFFDSDDALHTVSSVPGFDFIKEAGITHLYFNLNRPLFFVSGDRDLFFSGVRLLLRKGFCVTIDDNWTDNIPKETDILQANFANFELVLRLHIPFDTTLKIYDSDAKNTQVRFADKHNCTYFDIGPIKRYEAGDISGKKWLKEQKAKHAAKTETTKL